MVCLFKRYSFFMMFFALLAFVSATRLNAFESFADVTNTNMMKQDLDKGVTKSPAVNGEVDVKVDFVNLKQVEPHAGVFVDIFNNVDFSCVFPSQGAFTVFVPTGAAFNNMSADMKASLTDKNKLCDLLKSHVVAGKVDVQDGSKEFTTLNGKKLMVQVHGTDTFVNGAKVVKKVERPSGVVFFVVDKSIGS